MRAKSQVGCAEASESCACNMTKYCKRYGERYGSHRYCERYLDPKHKSAELWGHCKIIFESSEHMRPCCEIELKSLRDAH